jgi:hypothetical protein
MHGSRLYCGPLYSVFMLPSFPLPCLSKLPHFSRCRMCNGACDLQPINGNVRNSASSATAESPNSRPYTCRRLTTSPMHTARESTRYPPAPCCMRRCPGQHFRRGPRCSRLLWGWMEAINYLNYTPRYRGKHSDGVSFVNLATSNGYPSSFATGETMCSPYTWEHWEHKVAKASSVLARSRADLR